MSENSLAITPLAIGSQSAIWVAIIIGVLAGLAAGVVSAFAVGRTARMRIGDIQLEFLRERITSRVGAVICDYVDSLSLQTLAAQYGVGLSPEEIEKSSERKKTLGAKLGLKGSSEVSVGGESAEGQTFVYRVPADLNVLTREVVEAIASRERVRTDLADTPSIGLPEIQALVVAGTDRNLASAETLMDELLSVSKREQFKNVASSGEFLLVDASWKVALENGTAILRLAQLAASDSIVPMPSSISLEVRVPIHQPSAGELVTPQGLQRLRAGVDIRASVFGRVASIDGSGSILSVGAIAIFSRAGQAATSPDRFLR
ncbi:hypothetical protein [Streptomyces sp. NPDC005407]|uniref:hypothetical protein n=1 Tax=Streptomyces sp. NPDC005407 TaxID=3155340 RepID=UPI0033A0938F